MIDIGYYKIFLYYLIFVHKYLYTLCSIIHIHFCTQSNILCIHVHTVHVIYSMARIDLQMK